MSFIAFLWLRKGKSWAEDRTAFLGAVVVWQPRWRLRFRRAGGAAQQPAGADRKFWDGIYTAEQAARGKPRFEASCSRCHNNELIGSERGPTLKGSAFRRRMRTTAWPACSRDSRHDAA